MKLSGLHLLITYQCNLECDHCFVWSGPFQPGVMTLQEIRHILKEGKSLGSVEWIYFEGGEPFQYYPIMMAGIREAVELGFRVGVVSNAYWATSENDARVWLEPLCGLVSDLSISKDTYHWSEEYSQYADNAATVAQELGIPLGVISIAQPGAENAAASKGQLPASESRIMYRGRAAEKLADRAQHHPWHSFTECPYENLREPGRVHIDPYGYLHLCQGIVLGNLFDTPLAEIVDSYDPDTHPIVGSLLSGGPAELARCCNVSHLEHAADACHLCYTTRLALRERFPDILVPDQLYGIS